LAAFKSSTPAVRKGRRALGRPPASPVEDHPQGPAASFSAKRIARCFGGYNLVPANETPLNTIMSAMGGDCTTSSLSPRAAVLPEIVMGFKTWLEAIEKLEPYSAESVIREAPRTRFVGDLPPGFEFLKGAFINLGYENLGLPPAEVDALNKAILGTGLAVAGTQFRFRTERGFHTIIESADGSETASLPADWKQAVYVFDIGNDKYTWIGKKIRPDQMRNFDRNLYDAEPDGFSLKRVDNLP
jgi:hypothetical protein